MGLFGRKIGWDSIRSALAKSFETVRKDTDSLYQWVQFLHQKIQSQEQTIESLRQSQSQIESHLLGPDDVRVLIDQHHSIQQVEAIRSSISQLQHRIEMMASMHDSHHSQIGTVGGTMAEHETVLNDHKERLNALVSKLDYLNESAEKKGSSLKEKIVKTITRNSKTYVKNTIQNYIEKYHQMPALQLKEMVVDEQGLCSKSSFYRLLNELEVDQKVSVMRDGKQKIYIANTPKSTLE